MTRLGTGYSPALDKAMGWDLPDFKDDEFIWTKRMRGMMSGRMQAQGIFLSATRDRIIKQSLELADKRGVMGDERKTWRCFVKCWRDYLHEKKETALETLLADGKARGLTEDEIFDILRHARADNGGKLNFRDLRDRDKYGKAFQARALEKQKRIDQQNEESRREFAAIAEDRNMITDAMIDEHELNPDKIVFALPAHLAKSFGNTAGLHVRKIFDGAIDTWLSTHNNDTRLAWRLTLQYELKNAPIEISPQNGEIQSTSQTNTNQNETTQIVPQSATEKPIPESETKLPQGMLKVYPVDFGSIIYKGIKFSVTLEAGGTFEQAIQLMEEFAKHRELIAPNCLVGQPTTQPSAAPALPPPAGALPAPAAQPVTGTPDKRGHVPGQRGNTTITGVKKMIDEGKTEIQLWNATGKFPQHFLKEKDFAMVAALTDINGLAVGTKYPVDWTADWVVGTNKTSQDNYYLNVTAIRNNAAAQNAA